jgi:hypothetical protein
MTPSLRFPLLAGGTKPRGARFPLAKQALARFPSRSGGNLPSFSVSLAKQGNRTLARFPSRSGGNLQEGGNCELWLRSWYYNRANSTRIQPPSRIAPMHSAYKSGFNRPR